MSELISAFRELGYEPTEQEIKDIMGDLDRSGDQTIDFDEFLLIICKKNHFKYVAEDIIKAFKLFDTRNKGKLSV